MGAPAPAAAAAPTGDAVAMLSLLILLSSQRPAAPLELFHAHSSRETILPFSAKGTRGRTQHRRPCRANQESGCDLVQKNFWPVCFCPLPLRDDSRVPPLGQLEDGNGRCEKDWFSRRASKCLAVLCIKWAHCTGGVSFGAKNMSIIEPAMVCAATRSRAKTPVQDNYNPHMRYDSFLGQRGWRHNSDSSTAA